MTSLSASSKPDLEIAALVLAGGKSRRMGQPKGLLQIGARPWLAVVARDIKACGISQTVVVTGAFSVEYAKALVDFAANCACVTLPDPEGEPFDSLVCGLLALEPIAPAWVWLQPLDTLVPDASLARALLAATQSNEKAQVIRPGTFVPTSGTRLRGGHPLLLRWDFCLRILARSQSPGSHRLDLLIHELISDQGEQSVATIPTGDTSILLNFNTPEEWRDAKSVYLQRAVAV